MDASQFKHLITIRKIGIELMCIFWLSGVLFAGQCIPWMCFFFLVPHTSSLVLPLRRIEKHRKLIFLQATIQHTMNALTDYNLHKFTALQFRGSQYLRHTIIFYCRYTLYISSLDEMFNTINYRMCTRSAVSGQSPWVVWRLASSSPAWSSPSPPSTLPLR
jgi:hypothetical protein